QPWSGTPAFATSDRKASCTATRRPDRRAGSLATLSRGRGSPLRVPSVGRAGEVGRRGAAGPARLEPEGHFLAGCQVAVPVQTRCAHRLPAGGQVRVPPVDDVMAGGQGRCRRPTVELAVTGVAYYDLQHVTLVP